MSSLLRDLAFLPVMQGTLMAPDSGPPPTDAAARSSGGEAHDRSSAAGTPSASSAAAAAGRTGSGSSSIGSWGGGSEAAQAATTRRAGPLRRCARNAIRFQCAREGHTQSEALALCLHPACSPARPGHASRRLAASAAAFGVSGVWHELVFAHMTGGFTTRGSWTLFFMLQVRPGWGAWRCARARRRGAQRRGGGT